MNKNLFLLSIVFFFTFFGFGSVQQYLTSYFIDIWYENAGFYSLLFIYGGFLLSTLFCTSLIKKLGSKKSIIISILFYSLFIFSLLSSDIFVLYIASILIWISAGFLWISQQSYIVSLSKGKNVWKNVGIFNIFLFIWISLGSLLIWYLIPKVWYKNTFFIFWIFPLIAIFIALFLKKYDEVKIDKWEKNLKMFKYFKNIDLLKLWFFSLAINLNIGLFFSIIPVHIKNTLGIEYVWIIASIYYIFIMLSSFFVWKSADKYDNRYILILIYLMCLLSMWLLYFYEFNYIFLLLGIWLLAIIMSYMNVIILSLVNKLWWKKNIKDLFSFFFVFGNIWLVLGILLSTYIKDNLVYLISFILVFISLLSYITLFRKNLSEMKKDIN